jgi:hypothetical protein
MNAIQIKNTKNFDGEQKKQLKQVNLQQAAWLPKALPDNLYGRM